MNRRGPSSHHQPRRAPAGTLKKRCIGCQRPDVRDPEVLVCSSCWAGLPQPLKTAFKAAANQLAAREAARAIFEHLRNHSTATPGIANGEVL